MKVHLDLKYMDIRSELYPKVLPNGKTYVFFYSKKRFFVNHFKKCLKILMDMHQIFYNVNIKEQKCLNLKSHDGHILVQDIFHWLEDHPYQNKLLQIFLNHYHFKDIIL